MPDDRWLGIVVSRATCKIHRTRDFFVADWLAMVEGQAGAGVKGPTRNI
jgi:hypothetical protein